MNLQHALEIVSLTHAGMVRSHNEDSVEHDASCGLVVLADGMGGYNAGEVASGITVSVMAGEIRNALQNNSAMSRDENSGEDSSVVLLRDNVKKANASIYQAAQSQPQYAGMG
ncbi:MAG: protein phosphatase, partial [Gallionellaceae bacterium]|nr:protein phosphatase [Gallionellaceae bacterium]